MTIRTAIVPVAGLGTRLLPLSAATPKELLPLGSKPVIHRVAEELAQAGVQKVILVTSSAKQQIARYFQLDQSLEDSLKANGKLKQLSQLWSQSPYMSLDFDVEIQHQQLGLGDAVLCGEPKAPQPVIVALGDCVIGVNEDARLLNRMIEVFESRSADIVVAFEEVPREKVSRFGIANPVTRNDASPVFELGGLVEKPDPADAPSNLAVAARYVFSPQIFEELRKVRPGKNNEIQLTDAIASMIQFGAKAYGVRLGPDEKRFDVGNLNSFTEAFVQFSLADSNLHDSVISALKAFEQ